jgi:hypothetical protein
VFKAETEAESHVRYVVSLVDEMAIKDVSESRVRMTIELLGGLLMVSNATGI